MKEKNETNEWILRCRLLGEPRRKNALGYVGVLPTLCKAHSAGLTVLTKYMRTVHTRVKTYSSTGKHGFSRQREAQMGVVEGKTNLLDQITLI